MTNDDTNNKVDCKWYHLYMEFGVLLLHKGHDKWAKLEEKFHFRKNMWRHKLPPYMQLSNY